MYIVRECEQFMKDLLVDYPVLSVMGPRQAGKTKMIREHFSYLPYYDLERKDVYEKIVKNPAEFVRENAAGAIYDEVHLIPAIISEIKALSDEIIWEAHRRNELVSTRFVITGSHNYLFADKMESMVGRAAIIELMSMTACELAKTDAYEMMYKGGYPILHLNGKTPTTFFQVYVKSYLERELRLMKNVKDLDKFQQFMKLCANRVGNILDYETMASKLDIKVVMLREWLSLLQASYIIFLSPPYHDNFEKRLSRRPKLYFYDTGLASYLLGVQSQEELKTLEIKGKLFENLVMSDVKKHLLSRGKLMDSTYFWNIEGMGGYEVDLILGERANKSIEIKISDKFDPKWFANLDKFAQLTPTQKYVVYTGPTIDVPEGKLVNFKDVRLLV